MPQQFLDGFHRRLNQVVTIKMAEAMETLTKGAAKDFADYRYRVGYLDALHSVLDWCEEVERAEYGIKDSTALSETQE